MKKMNKWGLGILVIGIVLFVGSLSAPIDKITYKGITTIYSPEGETIGYFENPEVTVTPFGAVVVFLTITGVIMIWVGAFYLGKE